MWAGDNIRNPIIIQVIFVIRHNDIDERDCRSDKGIQRWWSAPQFDSVVINVVIISISNVSVTLSMMWGEGTYKMPLSFKLCLLSATTISTSAAVGPTRVSKSPSVVVIFLIGAAVANDAKSMVTSVEVRILIMCIEVVCKCGERKVEENVAKKWTWETVKSDCLLKDVESKKETGKVWVLNSEGDRKGWEKSRSRRLLTTPSYYSKGDYWLRETIA